MRALIAGIWLLVSTPADERLLPILPKTTFDPPTILATAEYWSPDLSKRQLTLCKMDLPHIRHIDNDAATKAYRDHTEGRKVDGRYLTMPIGDQAFVLVDSEFGKPQEGNVVSVVYSWNVPICPLPIVSLDIGWHSDRQKAFIVEAYSYSDTVWLWAEEIDLKKKPIAKYPLHLDNNKRTDWPRSTLSLEAQFKKTFTDTPTLERENHLGVKKIKVAVEKDSLLVLCERDDPRLPAACFRFNLNTRKWSEVKLKD